MINEPEHLAIEKVVYLLPAAIRDLIYGPDELKAIADILGFDPRLIDPNSPATQNVDLSEVKVVISGWGMPTLNAAMLHRMPSLEVVLYGAGSVKGFMQPEAWDRGVRVSSAFSANAIPVAEYTVAQIVLSLKQVWRFMRDMRARRAKPAWEERACVAGSYRSTVALLSLGMIGRMVAERLKAYDLNVIAYDPFVSDEQGAALGLSMVSLEEAFAMADVVSCHTPALPETRQMLKGRHFSSMRPYATFINTARGAVVDEHELIDVLRARPDLFAVLDVTLPEPPDPGSPFYSLPNVVLTPHIAGSMNRECQRMGQVVVEELRRWKAGEPLQWEISRARAAVMA